MSLARWIKILAASLVGTIALFYVVHVVLPPPWWWKEAGSPPTLFSQVRGWGTGFFVTRDGWLLTNRHVTAGCSRVSIGNGTLSGLVGDKVLYPITEGVDLAAVHVALRTPAFLHLATTPWPSPAAKHPTPVAEITQDLQATLSLEGRRISIIGFPGYDHRATPVRLHGVLVGAWSVDQRHWFQSIDAPVRSGSSGSPVIDARGEVVGVVSRINISLLGKPSAAAVQQALSAPPPSASQGMIEPAAIARDLLLGVAPAADYKPTSNPADPRTAVVRVFCFH